jgi:hypothetical protein
MREVLANPEIGRLCRSSQIAFAQLVPYVRLPLPHRIVDRAIVVLQFFVL